MPVNGKAVAGLGAASVLIYAGVKGKSVRGAIQFIVTGKSPANAPGANTILGSQPDTSGSGSGSGGGTIGPGQNADIAADAMHYRGHHYVYGGAPGPNGTDPWDCSSFCNWVLGHDMGLTLPGGLSGYNGSSHGPTTLGYLTWSGARTINRKSVSAGDLCVWQTHIGIAISNTQMISALNENLGTQVTTISGGSPGGELLVCRRVN